MIVFLAGKRQGADSTPVGTDYCDYTAEGEGTSAGRDQGPA